MMVPKKRLRIGYLWQIDRADIDKITATPLHVKAVISGLERRSHQVRLLTQPKGVWKWTDDREHWHAADLGWSQSTPFRRVESVVRAVQSGLRLPYFNLFESIRFAQAAVSSLADYNLLYERHWLLNYGGLMAARRLDIPLILEVNGDLFAEYRQLGIKLSRAQWTVIRFLNRHLFRKADHVIAVSETLRERLLERWDLAPDRVTTVHNGADVDLFAQQRDGTSLRRQYHVNGNPTVAFVGSFKPWHGIDLLVTAFADVARLHPEVKLLLVGDGPLRSEIEKMIKSLGLQEQIILTGKLPHGEVASLLSIVDVAVLNPRATDASAAQSPLKLFEYMAAGKAIVAPAAPNVKDIFDDGNTGLLISPNDPAALSRAVCSLLENPTLRTEIGKKAQRKALEEYSWDQTVAKIDDVMQSLLDE